MNLSILNLVLSTIIIIILLVILFQLNKYVIKNQIDIFDKIEKLDKTQDDIKSGFRSIDCKVDAKPKRDLSNYDNRFADYIINELKSKKVIPKKKRDSEK